MSNILITIGEFLVTVVVTSAALTTILVNSDKILKKLPLDKVFPALKKYKYYEYWEGNEKRSIINDYGKIWKEKKESGEEINTFKEIERNRSFITIYDESRDMTIKIPIEGGQLLVTWAQRNWLNLQYRYVRLVTTQS